jgi:outer membrane biosynthesis protein TonB
MDRAETTGLGLAVAAHGALLFALSMATPRLPPIGNQPIEVAFVEDAGPVSAAPEPSSATPAPSVAPELGTPRDAAPLPAEPVPAPRADILPKAKPDPVPAKAWPDRTVARPTPQPAPRGSRLGADILKGLGADPTPSQSQDVPAATMSAAAVASLSSMVRRQLKPHWKAPTGADSELLRTELSIWLDRDGSVSRVEVIRTTGQTASNRPQVRLHQEQAVRAVRLAAPFRLPPEYYDAWKQLSPIGFDKRLSQ